MSSQVVCDGCGEPIDQSVTYYTAQIQAVILNEDGVLVGGGTTQRDWHVEHAPVGAVEDADG